MMKSLKIVTIGMTALLLGTGCLKTRAQLRDEPADAAADSSHSGAARMEPVAAQSAALDEIKSELTRLNGRIEELERASAQQAKTENTAAQEQTKKLEARVVELEQAQLAALEAVKKLQVAQPPADAPDLFEKGKEQVDSGDLNAAVESLSGYLRNPKGKHAEEATFLRGEAYYGLKQYKKAIMDFSKFPEHFGKSKRVPTALYKIGQSFEALGMRDDAKGFYQELVEKFPRAPEAKKAKSRIR